MENKSNIPPDKRIGHKLKDRGDSLQKVNKIKNIATKKDFMPDRGDTESKSTKLENVNDKNTKAVVKNKNANNSESMAGSKKTVVENGRNMNRLLDYEEKKRVRDKYTVRAKPKITNKKYAFKFSNVKDSLTEINDDSLKKRNKDSKEKVKQDDNIKLENTKADKQSDTRDSINKRPFIRTVIAKNDATKVYKAVTFTEQKRRSTPLHIQIPNEVLRKATKIPKLIQSCERASGMTVREKSNKNRGEKQKNNSKSSDNGSPISTRRRSGSPPTEVAKWGPNSVNKHTRPYYEAWVNTALTAVAKMSKNDKMLLKAQNLDTFKGTLTRRESPELMYEHFLDERYTGKIKINHR